MAYGENYELGDKVWYETDDGNRYLMVVKDIHSDGDLDLYPYYDTKLLLKDKSESKFRYIFSSKVSLATVVTTGNMMKASKVAEVAIKRAVSITEAKGHSLSSAQ